jgi:hypothetical protein
MPTTEVRYSLSETEQLLNSPRKEQDVLKDYQRAFFERSLAIRRRRVLLDDAPSSKSYEGDWYLQSGQSCVTWSLVNGLKILGKAPNPQLVRDFLNETDEESGSNLLYAGNRLNEEKQARLALLWLSLNSKQDLWERASSLIRQEIQSENVLLASAVVNRYIPVNADGLHALCLSGYRLSPRKTMDVQVIDSNYGRIWTSLEHIVQSMYIVPELNVIQFIKMSRVD